MDFELTKLAVSKPSSYNYFNTDKNPLAPPELKSEMEKMLQRAAIGVANIGIASEQLEIWKLIWANHPHSGLARLAEREAKKLGYKFPSEDLCNQPFISRLAILVYKPTVLYDLDALLATPMTEE